MSESIKADETSHDLSLAIGNWQAILSASISSILAWSNERSNICCAPIFVTIPAFRSSLCRAGKWPSLIIISAACFGVRSPKVRVLIARDEGSFGVADDISPQEIFRKILDASPWSLSMLQISPNETLFGSRLWLSKFWPYLRIWDTIPRACWARTLGRRKVGWLIYYCNSERER
jgi:hypothetical protein